MLHLPPNALGAHGLLDVEAWGLPRIAAVRAPAAGAALRTAWRCRAEWLAACRLLDMAAESGLDMVKYHAGDRSPEYGGPARGGILET